MYLVKSNKARTLKVCWFEIQAEEIKCSWRRKVVSSQPVVVEDRVTGERYALPLQLSGKAKTSAAAIVEVDVCGLAGWCQNHGSCCDGRGGEGKGRETRCGFAKEGGREVVRRWECGCGDAGVGAGAGKATVSYLVYSKGSRVERTDDGGFSMRLMGEPQTSLAEFFYFFCLLSS